MIWEEITSFGLVSECVALFRYVMTICGESRSDGYESKERCGESHSRLWEDVSVIEDGACLLW